MQMKDDSPIFRDHPTLGDGEQEAMAPVLANAATVTEWLQTNPDLRTLKVAALVEATTHCRYAVLGRILGRLFKLEKAEAMRRLLTLEE